MADKRALYNAMEDWKIAIDGIRNLQQQINELQAQIGKNQQRIADAQARLIQAQDVEAQRFTAIEQAMK